MTPNTVKKGILHPEMFHGLIEAAIWTNEEFREDGLDADIGDFADSSIAYLEDLCREFESAFSGFCTNPRQYLTQNLVNHTVLEYVGHDLWLTVCGHGAGFWDGDWDGVGDGYTPWENRMSLQLSEWCRKHGEIELYVGDDKLIYIFGKENYAS